MTKLISLLSLMASALIAEAQTTNVTIRITVVEPGVTNVFNNITASPTHIAGFIAAQERLQRISGTNTPTFANAVRLEVIDQLSHVAKAGASEDMERRRVNAAVSQLPTLWPTMTPQDQAALIAIFQTYVP